MALAHCGTSPQIRPTHRPTAWAATVHERLCGSGHTQQACIGLGRACLVACRSKHRLYGLGGASRHVARSEVRRPGRPLRASHTLPETCEHSPTSARLICNDRRSCAACASTTEGCNDMSDRLQPPAAHFIWRAFVGNH